MCVKGCLRFPDPCYIFGIIEAQDGQQSVPVIRRNRLRHNNTHENLYQEASGIKHEPKTHIQ